MPEPTSEAPLWQAGLTIATILTAFVLMALEVAPPDMIMVAALVTFVPFGILTTTQATAGFAQRGLLTVMVLFAVTTGLERTGAFEPIRKFIIPKRGARTTAVHVLLLRFMAPVLVVSAFLNNTPVVALMIPTVSDLATKAGLSPSKLLIPLSYAAILGGTCTLIGTSTNLVLVSMAEKAVLEHSGEPFEFGFFEIGRVGLPVAGVCTFFLLLIAGPLLPSRDPAKGKVTRSRIYKLAAVVGSSSRLIGKTLDESGLAHIDGCALAQITRDDAVVRAPTAREKVLAGDRLAFEGQVDGIVALMREPRSGVRELLGLAPPSASTSSRLRAAAAAAASRADPLGADELMLPSGTPPPPPPPPVAAPAPVAEPAPARAGWKARARSALASLSPSSLPILVEVVLAPSSRVVGLRARAFGQAFDATVVAIARDEERTSSMVADVSEQYGVGVVESFMFAHRIKADVSRTARSTGEMALCADDSLLLLTTGAFLERYRTDGAFTEIVELEQHAPLRHSRAGISSALALAMIVVSIAAREQVDLLLSALFAVAAMLVTGCLTTEEAREAFRTDLFLVIGSAFGLSTAMQNSGAAALIANILVQASGDNVSVTVVLLYSITALLTEVITNNAAVALMFPIAFEAHIAAPEVFELRPLVYTLMLAASASFITPTGYQTNFMVYKPGGYKYVDFPLVGIPLQLVAMAVSCGVILTLDVWYLWALGAFGLIGGFLVLTRLFPRGWYEPTAYREKVDQRRLGGAAELSDRPAAPQDVSVV